jgi:DNA invertase Pin-like site-specific DNA recombinase
VNTAVGTAAGDSRHCSSPSALEYCCAGASSLLVTKLDRPARSARHLSELVDRLESKNVTLRILNFGGDCLSRLSQAMKS